jgi:hypothetical protein
MDEQVRILEEEDKKFDSMTDFEKKKLRQSVGQRVSQIMFKRKSTLTDGINNISINEFDGDESSLI